MLVIKVMPYGFLFSSFRMLVETIDAYEHTQKRKPQPQQQCDEKKNKNNTVLYIIIYIHILFSHDKFN